MPRAGCTAARADILSHHGSGAARREGRAVGENVEPASSEGKEPLPVIRDLSHAGWAGAYCAGDHGQDPVGKGASLAGHRVLDNSVSGLVGTREIRTAELKSGFTPRDRVDGYTRIWGREAAAAGTGGVAEVAE